MVSLEKVFWAVSWLKSTSMESESLNTMSTAALPWPGAEVRSCGSGRLGKLADVGRLEVELWVPMGAHEAEDSG